MPSRCHPVSMALVMSIVAGAARASEPCPVLVSPVRSTGVGGVGIEYVALDLAGYSAARELAAQHWAGFPLGPGAVADLDLEQFQVLAPDARLVLGGKGADRAMARPEVVLLKGSVAGAAGSRVYLGLTPTAMNGYILLDGRTYIVSSGPPTTVQPAAVYDVGATPEGLLRMRDWVCGADTLEQPAHSPGPGGGADTTCGVVRVALESDFEYSQVFGGNTTASAAYATTLLGAVSEIYNRDFGTALEIGYLRVWGTDTDPYTSGTINDRLNELQSYWNANMGGVTRSITHMLSGISAGAGGIAYLGVLCNADYGYSTAGWLAGHFPYPLVNNNDQNWDVMVVAHEIGHNFGAPHTHEMTPPVDGCGATPQDCTNANLGTIMSYCHTCPGGMTNMQLLFHPRTISEAVAPYLSGLSGCVQVRTGPAIDTQPASHSAPLGGQTQFSVAVSGGAPFTYSWRKFGVPLSNNGHFSGVSSPTLTISPVQALDSGAYTVRITNACGTVTSAVAGLTVATCYANCDGSTTAPVLNVLDFSCFLNKFAAGDPWANCDQSTTAPVLNVNDFACYLNLFAAGCS